MHNAELKILILDDEPFMLKLLERQLGNLGYRQMRSFDNGVEALAELEAEGSEPDVILLDINMPGMDGVEVVRHLSERGYAGGLILVSGEDDRMLGASEKLAREHRLKVQGTIHKPPTPAILAALLDRWLPPAGIQAARVHKQYDAESLRTAIEQNQLVNYYQPKVAAASGEWIGVETLVRWQHPQDGLVFPDQFIQVAEESGLIGALTERVLSNALAQARLWQDAGLNLRVAVNVSMDDLLDLRFADQVVALTQAAGVLPHSVVLEVTESRLMHKLSTVLDVLTRLRLKRFRLSIDDFGTGNSSLAQLRDIPFDELKIDQSFTHNAWQNQRLHAIFDGSLNLAGQLDMEVVAEGVEDHEDWRFLRQSTCDLVQGYFVARPMPAAALSAWHAGWLQRIDDEQLLGGVAGG